MRERKGFSAIEITIATVIVGVLAALTLPKLPTVIENQKVSAGKKVLYDLYAAQKRHFINYGSYATSLADLDTRLKVPDGFSLSVANNSGQIALLQRAGKSYGLGINAAGSISCSGAGCTTPALNSPGDNGGNGSGDDNGTSQGDDNGNSQGDDNGKSQGDDNGKGQGNNNGEDQGNGNWLEKIIEYIKESITAFFK